ncbi:hypothetical protein [Sapientia aquatica]|uniref:Uncharacterized protein n=1 Tax=Sapientia aquatica TaxID=1549640 RepID=A0A4R5VWM9_9BURK|nr:hypothetical protein [Sapientia aquatica]TDK63755.1 hypothetical protein E2I14_14390 [Sapientia aquatica]
MKIFIRLILVVSSLALDIDAIAAQDQLLLDQVRASKQLKARMSKLAQHDSGTTPASVANNKTSI